MPGLGGADWVELCSPGVWKGICVFFWPIVLSTYIDWPSNCFLFTGTSENVGLRGKGENGVIFRIWRSRGGFFLSKVWSRVEQMEWPLLFVLNLKRAFPWEGGVWKKVKKIERILNSQWVLFQLCLLSFLSSFFLFILDKGSISPLFLHFYERPCPPTDITSWQTIRWLSIYNRSTQCIYRSK